MCVDGQETVEQTAGDGAKKTSRKDHSLPGRSIVMNEHVTAHDSDIQSLEQASRKLVSKTEYDVLGQLLTSTQYDLDGVTELTSVSYEYDAVGRLIHTQVQDLDSLESQHTLIQYNDELLSKTLYEPNTGSETVYSDVLGRIRKTVRNGNTQLAQAPQAAIEQRMEYDAIGRLITAWDSVSNTTDRFIYDAYETTDFPQAFSDQTPYCPITSLCEVISGDGKSHDLYSYYDTSYTAGIVIKHVMNRRKGGAATEFKDFLFSFEYDGLGRPTKQTNPDGGMLSRHYADGSLASVSWDQLDGSTKTLYSLSNMNRFGTFQELTYGNGVRVVNDYDGMGRLKGITASTQAVLSFPSSILFDEQYALDSAATMLARNTLVSGDASTEQTTVFDQLSAVNEQFIYDGLGRLAEHQLHATYTDASIPDTTLNRTLAYDHFGNMLQGEHYQGYNYASPAPVLSDHCAANQLNFGTGPHTVRSTDDHVHCYDQFGRINLSQTYAITDVEGVPTTAVDNDYQRTITYNAFDKPLGIHLNNGNSLQFEYGPNKMRHYSKSEIDGVTEEVYYLMGGAYEYVESASGSKSRFYIDGIAVNETHSDDSETLDYFIKDYQGTTKRVVGDDLESAFPALLKNGYDYTPFGLRTINALLGVTEPKDERRGYTGHEHFEAFGIIHMNGRIYDATLGRFLSADPLVSHPLHSQSYNRYSYVMNNPMSFTDPSGYAGLKVDDDAFLETEYDTASYVYEETIGAYIPHIDYGTYQEWSTSYVGRSYYGSVSGSTGNGYGDSGYVNGTYDADGRYNTTIVTSRHIGSTAKSKTYVPPKREVDRVPIHKPGKTEYSVAIVEATHASGTADYSGGQVASEAVETRNQVESKAQAIENHNLVVDNANSRSVGFKAQEILRVADGGGHKRVDSGRT